ncbi:MAG: hypothetical protein KDH09_18825 [Chrysiogenetes bacterium]|nr:hypothetical protein [Chrysiogenetes bacterium]
MSDSLYTVRTPDGLELGPVRPETIVDLILTKKILGNETVSSGDGNWIALTEVDQFRRAVDKREGRLGDDEEQPISAAAQTDLDDLPPPPEPTVDIALDESAPIEEVTEEAEEILDIEEADEVGEAEMVEEHIDLGDIEDALEDVHLPTDPPKNPVEVPPAETAAADLDDGGISIDLGEELGDEVLDVEPLDEEEVLELETLELAGVQELEILEVQPEAARPATDVRDELKNPDNRYTIRNSDGLVLGPVRVATLRDLIQAGAVAISAEIQKNQDPWKPLAQVPELLYLYDQVKQDA